MEKGEMRKSAISLRQRIDLKMPVYAWRSDILSAVMIHRDDWERPRAMDQWPMGSKHVKKETKKISRNYDCISDFGLALIIMSKL
jgi:hypothetical protein